MTKILAILGLVVVTVALAALGCSPSAPAAVSGTSAAAEKATVTMLPGPTGTSSYIAGYAIVDLINKYSAKLKADIFESKNSMEGLMNILTDPKYMKFGMCYASSNDAAVAYKGLAPFKQPMPNLRALFQIRPPGSYAFITYDSKIKKPQDLVGKKIATDVKGGGVTQICEATLQQWGIFDKVNIQYVGMDKVKNAVIDGVADVGYTVLATKIGDKYFPSNLVIELLTSKPPFFVSVDEKTLKDMCAATGIIGQWINIPAGSLGNGVPSEAFGVYGMNPILCVDASMSPDIAYEITKKESYQKGAINSAAMLADLPLTESQFHAGSVKAFKEANVKVGN